MITTFACTGCKRNSPSTFTIVDNMSEHEGTLHLLRCTSCYQLHELHTVVRLFP